MKNTTIKVHPDDKLLAPGDVITLRQLDRRWWLRLYSFVTFRTPPMTTETVTVTGYIDNGTVDISGS